MFGFLRATSLVIVRRHGRGISHHANQHPPGSEDLMVPTLKKWLYGVGIRECPFQITNLSQPLILCVRI